jgi:hypothetical protein
MGNMDLSNLPNSSEMSLSERKKQECEKVLKSCNIPRLFIDRFLPQHGEDGKALREYLISSKF